jgi:hypothetical protein
MTGALTRSSAAATSLLLLGGTLAGCTFQDGEYFAQIRPQLSVTFVAREDRVIDARWQKLASGYEVRLEKASLQVESVQLLAAGAGATAAAFDPARPPAGYSLCHNGHCHADDGRLVPYEEIAAATGSGGGAGPRPVLSFAVGEAFDLLLESPGFRPLPCPATTECAVGRVHISQVKLTVSALRLEGQVRSSEGAALAGDQGHFVIDLTAAPEKPLVSLQTTLDLPADNRHPPQVDLLVALGIGAEVLDGLAWPTLVGADGSVSLAGDNPAASAGRMALLEHLQQAKVGGQVRRSGP